jgi:hypothetical protein
MAAGILGYAFATFAFFYFIYVRDIILPRYRTR